MYRKHSVSFLRMACLALTICKTQQTRFLFIEVLFCVQDYDNYGKREATQARLALRDSLAGLPQPENEYEITIPELPETEVAGTCISCCCIWTKHHGPQCELASRLDHHDPWYEYHAFKIAIYCMTVTWNDDTWFSQRAIVLYRVIMLADCSWIKAQEHILFDIWPNAMMHQIEWSWELVFCAVSYKLWDLRRLNACKISKICVKKKSWPSMSLLALHKIYPKVATWLRSTSFCSCCSHYR